MNKRQVKKGKPDYKVLKGMKSVIKLCAKAKLTRIKGEALVELILKGDKND